MNWSESEVTGLSKRIAFMTITRNAFLGVILVRFCGGGGGGGGVTPIRNGIYGCYELNLKQSMKTDIFWADIEYVFCSRDSSSYPDFEGILFFYDVSFLLVFCVLQVFRENLRYLCLKMYISENEPNLSSRYATKRR